jgi:hypothetical protein
MDSATRAGLLMFLNVYVHIWRDFFAFHSSDVCSTLLSTIVFRNMSLPGGSWKHASDEWGTYDSRHCTCGLIKRMAEIVLCLVSVCVRAYQSGANPVVPSC